MTSADALPVAGGGDGERDVEGGDPCNVLCTAPSRLQHDKALIVALQLFVHRLDKLGIRWCVLRNHEGFPRPASATSDVDLLIGCNLGDALGLLLDSSAGGSIRLASLVVRSGGRLLSVFLATPGSPCLHVDLFSHVGWAGRSLVDASVILNSSCRRPHAVIPSPGSEAAVSLLGYLFNQGEVKHPYRARIQRLLIEDTEGFVACLQPVWGTAVAANLMDHVERGDWAWFSAWAKRAKRLLLLGYLASPLECTSALIAFANNRLRRLLAAPGLCVAFLGPDGAGKTTVAEAYRGRLATVFHTAQQRHLHWRPRVLPAPGEIVVRATSVPETVTQPHARAVHGRLTSLLRYAYFCADYVIGHWLRVRPLLARNGLVTFDRYYHDFLVDPVRYRLKISQGLVRLVCNALPQPEILFILDAEASVLHRRKQELTQREIEFQQQALRKIAVTEKRAQLVDVAGHLPAIVDHLERVTLDHLDRRNTARLSRPPLAAKDTGA